MVILSSGVSERIRILKDFTSLYVKERSSVHTTFNLYVLFSPFNFESLFIMERVSTERK